MNNRYFGFRHGQSQANVLEIIVSSLQMKSNEEFSLTLKGEDQVGQAVQKAKDEGTLNGDTLVYFSPFLRCRRTAEIAREVLGVQSPITLDIRLAERWFGDLEGTHSSNYQKIWKADRINPNHTEFGVESVHAVQARTMALVNDLEDRYFGKTILLVSHGDALQILQTGFLGKSAAVHWELPYFETAEIRGLNT